MITERHQVPGSRRDRSNAVRPSPIEEAADGRPDVGVVQQVEVVHRAEPAAEVDRERDVLAGAAPPVRAGGLDEQIADDGAERAGGIRGDRGADRVVVRAG